MAPTRRRILLVESDESLARVIARVLGRRHRVVAVASVPEAVRALSGGAKGTFDVVVANYRLGQRASGGSLSRMLARQWPTVRRVLYLDSDAAPREAAGADVVVELPGHFDQLLSAVDGVLSL